MIGKDTRIWNYVNILEGAVIGEGCTIGSYTEIGKDVIIGDRCKIEAKVFIPKGVIIFDDVFIGPCVCFTNDRYPTAKDWGQYEETIVEDGAIIGAGSTIRCGVRIGESARIGAGTVVTTDVPPGVVFYGNPGRVIEGGTNNEW